LIFNQSFTPPERYFEPSRLDTMPSQLSVQAVLKDNRALLIMPVEGDAIADATKEIGERALAVFERLFSEVLAP
jgi:hypothetical protein